MQHLPLNINLNPPAGPRGGPASGGSDPLQNYPYSSFSYYLGIKNAQWLDTKIILDFFSINKVSAFSEDFFSYERFVKDYSTNPEEIIGNVTLDPPEGSDPVAYKH